MSAGRADVTRLVGMIGHERGTSRREAAGDERGEVQGRRPLQGARARGWLGIGDGRTNHATL